jgi:N-acetylneuraminic acid mutarotase
MKKIVYLILGTVIIFVFACKKETEDYSFYRPTHPQNFKSVLGGELYAFTAADSAVERADYSLKVKGKIKTYGSKIIAYGHCWSPVNSGNSNPYLNKANVNDTIFDDIVLELAGTDTLAFITRIPNLTANTRYYVRSFVITGDADNNPVDTGYNPIVTEISTVPAIDEWFEQFTDNKPQSFRFDAFAFNFGDSVFYGTGTSGFDNVLDDIQMYDPTTGIWNDNFATALNVEYYNDPTNGPQRGSRFANGIGFGLIFRDNFAPQDSRTKCIYYGLGDYGGNDIREEKSWFLIEYNLETGVQRKTENITGARRSSAVCFVIGDLAYVGTGKSQDALSDWHVYFPANDRDNDPETPSWRSMANNKPGGENAILRYGAIAFSINGRGYFGLGRAQDGTFLKDFWEYKPSETDPIGGSWTQKKDFPGEARANAVAFAIGDQGYVGTGDNIVGDMEQTGAYTGEVFNDFYRYDPFTDTWHKQQDYTADKGAYNRIDAIRPITRAVGYALPSAKVGFIGSGIVPVDYPVPNPPESTSGKNAQQDFWKYQPYDANGK